MSEGRRGCGDLGKKARAPSDHKNDGDDDDDNNDDKDDGDNTTAAAEPTLGAPLGQLLLLPRVRETVALYQSTLRTGKE